MALRARVRNGLLFAAVAAALCLSCLCAVPDPALAAGSRYWDEAMGIDMAEFLASAEAHQSRYLGTPYSMDNRARGPGVGMDCSSFWSFLIMREGGISHAEMEAKTGMWQGCNTTSSIVQWVRANDVVYETCKVEDIQNGKVKLAKGDFVVTTSEKSWDNYDAMLGWGSHVAFFWGAASDDFGNPAGIWWESLPGSGSNGGNDMYLRSFPVGGGNAFVVHGSGEVDSSLAGGEQTANWRRIWGNDALETMFWTVGAGWGSSDFAILSTVENFPDALAASSLAGLYHAPVLMTASDSLSSQTEGRLTGLNVSKVYVCGGKFAVSEAVADKIEAMGIEVERLAGDRADDTAVEIAQALEAGQAEHADMCIVVTEANFADALSASPYAYATGTPIFLTRNRGAQLSDATLEAIEQGGYAHAVVVGGIYAVSQDVEAQLAQVCSSVERIAGNSAVDTSILLARWQVEQGTSFAFTGFATDKNFPDALAGAALCGANQGVLLLANSAEVAKVAALLEENLGQLEDAVVFGGRYAVPYDVQGSLYRATMR